MQGVKVVAGDGSADALDDLLDPPVSGHLVSGRGRQEDQGLGLALLSKAPKDSGGRNYLLLRPPAR